MRGADDESLNCLQWNSMQSSSVLQQQELKELKMKYFGLI